MSEGTKTDGRRHLLPAILLCAIADLFPCETLIERRLKGAAVPIP
jgi:hypothetical protein